MGWRNWTWKRDVIGLCLLGLMFALVYSPSLFIAWIIVFAGASLIGHLIWLNIRITLDEELIAKLTAEAKSRGITFAQAVEDLIREHFEG